MKRSVIRCRSLFLSLLFLLGATLLPLRAYDAATDSQQRLLNDIKYLASDELEGRGVGLKGLDQVGW